MCCVQLTNVCIVVVHYLPHTVQKQQKHRRFVSVFGDGKCRVSTAVIEGVSCLQPFPLHQGFKSKQHQKILYRININLSSAYLCIHNIYSRSFTLSPIPPHTISLSISLNITLNSNSCTCMQILFYKSQSCHKEFFNAHIPLMFSIKVSRMMKESFQNTYPLMVLQS